MLQLARIKWWRLALAWALFILFMILLVYVQAMSSPQPVSWRAIVLGPLLNGVLWMLLTPLVFGLAARFDLTSGRRRLVPYGLAHALASVVLTLLFRLLSVAGQVVLAVPGVAFSWPTVLSSVNIWVPLYWMLLLGAYALELSDRARRRGLEAAHLETQLVQAQLQALKMQLNPHFLFNTLNAIAALTGDDPKAGQRMMAKLGQFLRRVLDHSDVQQVTLAQEIQFTALYLEIEQIRFCDRLTLDYQLDPKALPGLVPSLLLQPLVENAVRHGLAPSAGGGTIRIQAAQRGGRLLLTVQDNGPGAATAAPSARGVGLRNSEARLRTLYGAAGYALTIQTAPAQGFTVHLDLPFMTTS